VKEAKKRGLSNITTSPPAMDALVSKKSKKLFVENNIFSEREAEARHEILLETYTKKIQIESRVMGDLALNHIIPTAIKYQKLLVENVEGMKQIGLKADTWQTQMDIIIEISEHISVIKKNTDEMTEARKKTNKVEHAREKAIAYCDKVRPYFDTIRYHIDKLELIVDDEMWTMPKYREMVSIK
jgi:glutamine synthetase